MRRLWGYVTAMLVVALVLPSPFALDIALTGLVLLSGTTVWMLLVAHGMSVRCESPAYARPGEQVDLRLAATNRSRLPAPWVVMDLELPGGLSSAGSHRAVADLAGRSSSSATFRITTEQRGRYHIGPPQARIGDVFGIRPAETTRRAGATLTVLPNVVPVQRLDLPARSPLAMLASPRSLLEDQTAVVGVREYVQGDPLRRVHWTATAASGHLVVKQYLRAESRDTMVCLDLHRSGYPRGRIQRAQEQAIIVTASVLSHTIGVLGLPAGLLVGSWAEDVAAPFQVPPRDSREHLHELLVLLALAEAHHGAALPALLAHARRALAIGTTLVIVTGRVSEELPAHLVHLRRSGVDTAVILVAAPEERREIAPLRELGIAAHHIEDARQLRSLAL